MNGKWFAALLFILLWVCVIFSIFSASAISAEAGAKARAEGRVVLYSYPGRENVEPVVKEFERQHPGIKVQVSYGKGSQLQEAKRAPAGPRRMFIPVAGTDYTNSASKVI